MKPDVNTTRALRKAQKSFSSATSDDPSDRVNRLVFRAFAIVAGIILVAIAIGVLL